MTPTRVLYVTIALGLGWALCCGYAYIATVRFMADLDDYEDLRITR